MTSETPPPASGRLARWAGMVGAELLQTVWLLALLVGALLVLLQLLEIEREGSLADLLLKDGSGAPILPRLLAGLRLSGALVGGALLIALPLATLLGWAAVGWPQAERLRWLLSMASAAPLVVVGAIAQQAYGNSVALAVLTLAASELTLGSMAAHVRIELGRELALPYLELARAKGVSPLRHYWRPLVSIALASVRPRVPYLLGATLVVERIFAFDDHGLSGLVFNGMEQGWGGAALFWVGLIGLLLVRALSLAERVVGAALDPRLGGRVAGQRLGLPAWRLAGFGRGLSAAALALLWLPLTLARALAVALGRAARGALELLRGGPLGWLALAGGLLISAAAVGMLGHALLPTEAVLEVAFEEHAPPDAALPLGADASGRDLALALRLAGANMLRPLAVALLLPLLLGTALGLWVGSGESLARTAAESLIDLLEAVPKLVIVLAAIWTIDVDEAYLDRLLPLVGALFTPMVYFAVRDRTQRVASDAFVEAQRALGAGPLRILGLHVLWNNCRDLLLAQAALLFAYLLTMDLTLAYLGYSQPDEDLVTLGRLAAVGLRDAAAAGANPWVRDAPLLVIATLASAAALWSELLRQESAA